MTPADVVIVGAGQAGLALGHQLRQRGITPLLLDAAPRVGDAWRRRWDSLTLFTPRRYALPGLAMPGDPDGYPGKDEVADYLEAYAARFELDVRGGEPVTDLTTAEDGGFAVTTPAGTYEARQVVLATGPFATPAVPPFAGLLGPGVTSMHSSDYRNPVQLPGGDVVVVGGGNTGVQIAQELAATHRVALSTGSLGRALPLRLLGRDLFWWFERLGLARTGPDTRRGRAMRRREPIIGTDVRALLRRVRHLPRATGARPGELLLADGTTERPAAVIWATGFRPSYPWLRVPVLGADGAIVHDQGRTAVPGLHVIGQPWQRNRGSALLGWVGEDAALLAGQIAATPVPVSP